MFQRCESHTLRKPLAHLSRTSPSLASTPRCPPRSQAHMPQRVHQRHSRARTPRPLAHIPHPDMLPAHLVPARSPPAHTRPSLPPPARTPPASRTAPRRPRMLPAHTGRHPLGPTAHPLPARTARLPPVHTVPRRLVHTAPRPGPTALVEQLLVAAVNVAVNVAAEHGCVGRRLCLLACEVQ